MALSLGKKWGLRRLADENGHFRMASLDQRPPIEQPIAAKLGCQEAPYDEVVKFKRLIIESFQDHCSAMLLDPIFALPGCVDALSARKGLFVSLEDHFPQVADGGAKQCAALQDWDVARIKKAGGEAVKFLIFYHPQAPAEICRHNQQLARAVGQACADSDIPYVLELLSYPLAESSMSLEEIVTRSVQEFVKPDYQVDAFMIESPIAATELSDYRQAPDPHAQAAYKRLAEMMARPWIMLSMGADMPQFQNIMHYAYAAGSSGYLAGRAYWQDALALYPDWASMAADLSGRAWPYLSELNTLTAEQGMAWYRHSGFELSRKSPASG